MMKYCKCCVMLETKLDLQFAGDGICNACRTYNNMQTSMPACVKLSQTI